MDQTLTLQPYVGTWPPDDPDAGFRWMEQKDEVEHVGSVVVVNAGSVRSPSSAPPSGNSRLGGPLTVLDQQHAALRGARRQAANARSSGSGRARRVSRSKYARETLTFCRNLLPFRCNIGG